MPLVRQLRLTLLLLFSAAGPYVLLLTEMVTPAMALNHRHHHRLRMAKTHHYGKGTTTTKKEKGATTTKRSKSSSCIQCDSTDFENSQFFEAKL